MSSQLYIKCEELVSIPTGMGIFTNVVFNPKKDTDQNIRAAESFGGYFDIHVEDKGGDHVTNKPQRVMSVRRERDVLIFTSKTM